MGGFQLGAIMNSALNILVYAYCSVVDFTCTSAFLLSI